MFSAILLAISIATLSQFALYYWRAMVAGVAARPVSGRVLVAAGIDEGRIDARHFGKLSGLLEVTPRLDTGSDGFGLVRFYYHTARLIGASAGRWVPALTAWSQRECKVCAQYAAVQIDRRLQANLAMAATVRSC